MTIKKPKIMFLIAATFIIILAFALKSPYAAITSQTLPPDDNIITIAIDPGHGGYDPGKIGIDGTPEKDINLAVSLFLKEYLTQLHYNVITTRETDIHLYEEGCKSRKTDDLNHRIKIIEDASCDIAISIHQNSFSDSSVHGPQVFYYNNSETSRLLAESIQNSLITETAPESTRPAKPDSSYYMLRKTSCPIVIVECGFLSNPSDAALLNTRNHQMQTAHAICTGITNYLNSR